MESITGRTLPNARLISDICIDLQQEQGASPTATFNGIVYVFETDSELALDVLDVLLDRQRIDPVALEDLLDRGGSTLRVSPSKRALDERVSDAAEKAVTVAVTPGDAAAGHLVEAWDAAHSREPDAERACAMATRAVEAILKPIASPKDRVATFGKMKAAIRDSPSSFAFELADDAAAFLPYLELAGYQPGRHGGDDKAPPSLAQARAIVQAAVMLVEWIRTGVFRRAD